MAISDSYAHGFDENVGKTIAAETCPECTGIVRTEGGETACEECGLIVDEQYLASGRYGRAFAGDVPEHARERTGAPLTPTRHDRGLSSEIGWKVDGNGNTLPGRNRRQWNRLRKWNQQAKWNGTRTKNLGHACSDISRLCGALDLPDSVTAEASTIFREVQQENLLQGRSIEAMSAASVYAACRRSGQHRTLDELVDVTTAERQQVRQGFRVLCVELGLEIPVQRPQEFIPRIASECNFPTRVRLRAHEFAQVAEDSDIANGRRPSGVAAACLYLASQEHHQRVTQADLADAAGTTPVTLRKRMRELEESIANQTD